MSKDLCALRLTEQKLAASNRLTGINTSPAKSYAFDANGSVTADGQNSFAYDARGRMKQATHAGGTTYYRIDPFGRRDAKAGNGTNLRFVYDLDGHLLVEADVVTGLPLREYIWLADLPVGVLQ